MYIRAYNGKTKKYVRNFLISFLEFRFERPTTAPSEALHRRDVAKICYISEKSPCELENVATDSIRGVLGPILLSILLESPSLGTMWYPNLAHRVHRSKDLLHTRSKRSETHHANDVPQCSETPEGLFSSEGYPNTLGE